LENGKKEDRIKSAQNIIEEKKSDRHKKATDKKICGYP